MPDACDSIESVCASKPDATDTKYGAGDGASYSRINTIECTAPLFRCGYMDDNVCLVNKVASRLGLGPEATSDPLFLRSNGQRIR
jgi:hypothetical protein